MTALKPAIVSPATERGYNYSLISQAVICIFGQMKGEKGKKGKNSMRNAKYIFAILAIGLLAGSALAADRYVVEPGKIANGNDLAPYNTWTNAATNIQWAVNVATNGDTVWVSNGTYYCSGVSTSAYMFNTNIYTNTAMVMITNSITVQSVNGYTNTVVDGNWPFWTTTVFHVYATGAVLSGLTVTNGVVLTSEWRWGAQSTVGAGVYFCGKLVTNCLITGNVYSNYAAGIQYHAGALCVTTGDVSHCIIRGNRAYGTYVYGSGYSIYNTGGTRTWLITNCEVSYNYSHHARNLGALRMLVAKAKAVNCNVHHNNSAGIEIDGPDSVAESCVSSSNNHGLWFNGMGGLAKNCLIIGNANNGVQCANQVGSEKIESCTIVNNGIGVTFDTRTSSVFTAVNCVIYDNATNWVHAGTNMSYTNCCTYPLPTNVSDRSIGAGNITNAPMLVDTNSGNYRLAANSPCINTGANQGWMTNSGDLDGRMRIRYGRADMGPTRPFTMEPYL